MSDWKRRRENRSMSCWRRRVRMLSTCMYEWSWVMRNCRNRTDKIRVRGWFRRNRTSKMRVSGWLSW